MSDPNETTKPAKKAKGLAIDPDLHRFLDLLRARDGKQFKEIVEPELWNLVRENREWLERMTGGPVNIPDAAQLALIQ